MRTSTLSVILAVLFFVALSVLAAEKIMLMTIYRDDSNELTGTWDRDCYGNTTK